MKKILSILISRGFIIGLSIVAQVLFWMMICIAFRNHTGILVSVMTLLSTGCLLHIVIKDIHPEHKIAWIFFIGIFQIAGGMFYVLFGSHRVNKQTKVLHEQIERNNKKLTEEMPELDLSKYPKELQDRKLQYLKKKANAPAYMNTSVTYYKLGEEMLEALLEELKQATKFIFIESFIIEQGKMWNSIEEILIQKAKEGVDVRVLYDDLGCLLTLPRDFSKRLAKHHIDCRPFNKMNHVINANFNNRDHRKICVIDGNVGFNGGVNLADEYINQKLLFGHWKDTAVMLKGDAVYSLTMMFLSMWEMQTGKLEEYTKYAPSIQVESDGVVQPFADNPLDDESVGENIYMSILNTAKDYVYITSPYLIITREMIVALTTAAKSGIDVRLILPGVPDKKFVQFLSRSYYSSLVKAGVRIFEYTPGFVHSKMFISDNHTAIVGTINLDYRSLDLHYECATMMYHTSTITDILEDFLETQEKSQEVTEALIKKNYTFGFIRFFALGVLKIFSPLM